MASRRERHKRNSLAAQEGKMIRWSYPKTCSHIPCCVHISFNRARFSMWPARGVPATAADNVSPCYHITMTLPWWCNCNFALPRDLFHIYLFQLILVYLYQTAIAFTYLHKRWPWRVPFPLWGHHLSACPEPLCPAEQGETDQLVLVGMACGEGSLNPRPCHSPT